MGVSFAYKHDGTATVTQIVFQSKELQSMNVRTYLKKVMIKILTWTKRQCLDHFKYLMRFYLMRLLSGHLLGNSCPLG